MAEAISLHLLTTSLSLCRDNVLIPPKSSEAPLAITEIYSTYPDMEWVEVKKVPSCCCRHNAIPPKQCTCSAQLCAQFGSHEVRHSRTVLASQDNGPFLSEKNCFDSTIQVWVINLCGLQFSPAITWCKVRLADNHHYMVHVRVVVDGTTRTRSEEG